MKRRRFLQSSLVTSGSVAAATLRAEAASPAPDQEFYELRSYNLKDDTQLKLVETYLEKAYIPAMNRLGSTPIGVFLDPHPGTPLRVLTPFTSVEHFLESSDRLLADPVHNQAGADYLNIEAPDKAYERIDSSLLRAFPGMPHLQVPKQAQGNSPRLVQLRTYSSHSEVAGKKKIEMFHKGEIDIFKRVGLTPVFFSENLAGPGRPCLTYMLVFDDKAALDKAWGRFGHDPEWQKLKTIPEYMDKRIVSNISNLILNPTSYSQI